MNKYIKYALGFAGGLLLSGNSLVGQIVKTDYFMESSITRNYLNPALTPEQGYIIMPVIPSLGVGLKTNTLNLDNLTFKNGGERVTFMHESVSSDKFLKKINSDNYLGADVNMKLFALGFYKGENFWNIDFGYRVHTDANLPKPLFELLKVGFVPNGSNIYDLSEINANVNSFAEIGVSHSRPFMDNSLILGTRVKLLAGLAHADLRANKLEIEANEQRWRASSEVTLNGAAPGATPTYDSDGYFDGFDFEWEGIPGWGLGLDLGAVYDVGSVLPVLNGLKVSAALNDIGFISWDKKHSLALKSDQSEVTVELDRDYENGTSLEAVFEDALDELREAVNLKEDQAKAFTTGLRTTLNIGAEYEIMDNKLSVGALFSNYFGTYYNQTGLTLSGNYRPCNWFATALSYSGVGSQFDTFGLALHFIPKRGLNLFISGDYVDALWNVSPQYLPTTGKGANIQFGISVPLGSRH